MNVFVPYQLRVFSVSVLIIDQQWASHTSMHLYIHSFIKHNLFIIINDSECKYPIHPSPSIKPSINKTAITAVGNFTNYIRRNKKKTYALQNSHTTVIHDFYAVMSLATAPIYHYIHIIWNKIKNNQTRWTPSSCFLIIVGWSNKLPIVSVLIYLNFIILRTYLRATVWLPMWASLHQLSESYQFVYYEL